MLQVFSTQVSATELTDDAAIRAILGEAENQGAIGMLAVACVIRTRKSLAGIFGAAQIRENNGVFIRVSKKGIRRIDPKIVDAAREAWALSAKKDITNGATHFENVKAFGFPNWARDMRVVFEHGDHVFFRRAL